MADDGKHKGDPAPVVNSPKDAGSDKPSRDGSMPAGGGGTRGK
jgi:hypothetical protein